MAFKGHAENEFWKWMASWAVMLRKPSDLGYANDGYDFRHSTVRAAHVVASTTRRHSIPGLLFPMEARVAFRADFARARYRCRAGCNGGKDHASRPAFRLVVQSQFGERSARQSNSRRHRTSGSDSDDAKERKLMRLPGGRNPRSRHQEFHRGWFGLNWQHCADTGFVGLNDSFEQVYPGCSPVLALWSDEACQCPFHRRRTEGAVVANIKRKEADAERMAASDGPAHG
jgi:hypothetical protein